MHFSYNDQMNVNLRAKRLSFFPIYFIGSNVFSVGFFWSDFQEIYKYERIQFAFFKYIKIVFFKHENIN